MSGIPAKIAVDLLAEGTTIIAPAIINPYKQQKQAKLVDDVAHRNKRIRTGEWKDLHQQSKELMSPPSLQEHKDRCCTCTVQSKETLEIKKFSD